ncbi:hypothetical protein ACVVIH_06960 [Chryseobacterium arthrosphaerae]
MKGERFYISKLWFFDKAELYEGIQQEELIFRTINKESEYFTPGSAYYDFEIKPTVSGIFLLNTIVLSIPGFNVDLKKFYDIRAVVAESLSGSDIKMIVMHKNDYFSNTPIQPTLNASLDRTQIKFSTSSLDSCII